MTCGGEKNKLKSIKVKDLLKINFIVKVKKLGTYILIYFVEKSKFVLLFIFHIFNKYSKNYFYVIFLFKKINGSKKRCYA